VNNGVRKFTRPKWFLILGCALACGFSLWAFRIQFLPIPKVCLPDGILLNINNVEPKGENITAVGHLGGEASSIFIRGTHAFAKFGPELAILDISDPAHMTALHLSDPRNGITSIKIVNENVYITTRDCEYFDLGTLARYKIACKNSLHVVNILTPEGSAKCYGGFPGDALLKLKAGDSPELIEPPTQVQVGNLSYRVSRQAGLEIIDNSIAVAPVQIGSYFPPYKFTKLIVYGSNAFVTSLSPYPRTDYELQVINISDPANPTYSGVLPFYPSLLASHDNLAFVRNFPSDEVEFFDMREPFSANNKAVTSPVLENVHAMAIADEFGIAALNSGKFRIIDFSDPSQPATLGEPDFKGLGERTVDIAVAGHYTYVTVHNLGLWIWDIADLSHPSWRGVFEADMPWKFPSELAAKNDVVFMAVGESAKPDKLEIVDVSDPLWPRLIGTYEGASTITAVT
jgi:hypothetical protein